MTHSLTLVICARSVYAAEGKRRDRIYFSILIINTWLNDFEDISQGHRPLCATHHCLVLVNICAQCGKNPSRTVGVTERTRHAGRTDKQKDGQTAWNQYTPLPTMSLYRFDLSQRIISRAKGFITCDIYNGVWNIVKLALGIIRNVQTSLLVDSHDSAAAKYNFANTLFCLDLKNILVIWIKKKTEQLMVNVAYSYITHDLRQLNCLKIYTGGSILSEPLCIK